MLPLNRGLSRALKTVRRTVFAPRYADAGPGLFSSSMVHLKAAASRKKGNKKTPCNLMQGVCGAPSGTRTQDPLIKSQLLSLVARTHGVTHSHLRCELWRGKNATGHTVPASPETEHLKMDTLLHLAFQLKHKIVKSSTFYLILYL